MTPQSAWLGEIRPSKPSDRQLWKRTNRGGGVYTRPPDMSGWLYYALAEEAVMDNGSGHLTGTASSHITNAADVGHYIYRWLGFTTSSTYITLGSSTFGSFEQARTDLNAKVSGNWDIVYRILTPETPDESGMRIMSQAPIAFWRSQWDSKMKAQVYKTTPDDWDYFLNPDDDPHSWSWTEDIIKDSWICGSVPVDECYSEVRIKYDLHAPTGQYLKETWVGPAGSDDGTGTRDQNAAAPENREVVADFRRDNMGIKNTLTLECDQIYLDTTAVAFRNYLFDRYRPRVRLQFDTWARVIGLEPHHVTLISDDVLDAVGPPPVYTGISGGVCRAWSDINFFVAAPVILRNSPHGPIATVSLEEMA